MTSAMQKLRECSGSRRFRAANDAREARELAQQMGEDNSGANRGGKYNDQKGLEVFFWNDLNKFKERDSSFVSTVIASAEGHVWSSLWLQLYYSRQVGSETTPPFDSWSLGTKPHGPPFGHGRHSLYGQAHGAFALLHLQKDPGLQLIMSCWNHIPRKNQEWNKHETQHHKRSRCFVFKSTNWDISNETLHRLVSLSWKWWMCCKEDPAWQCFRVVLSGPETPGEGEHKIMDYIRKAKVWHERVDFAASDFLVKCCDLG